MRGLNMSKELVGFSVSNSLLNKFNDNVQRNYRYRKIREYIKNLNDNIEIKSSISKDVSIYPIRLDEIERRKINRIVINNSSKGNKVTGSDVISYVINEINSMPVRIRDTMHTSFTLDANVYQELVTLLKGDIINLSFEEFVLNDYKTPNIEYIKSYKSIDPKAIPILLDKSVIKLLDQIKDSVSNIVGKKVSRSNIIRDAINQMIVSFKNEDNEVIQLQEKIMNDILSLKSIGGEKVVKELIEEVQNLVDSNIT